ncbi:XkdQ/YqbQ family protein [Clostridium hydrogenum]|uniref:XkdQ/YqbQ family protein n=1 Tax=Clostridium hydrogenum TaxID=2855764 RepID=UPI001F314C51|nr:terminase [Clostridium hydrogenum]
MIHAYSLYDRWLVTDITGYLKTIEWSGDLSQCARKIECTLAYSIFDKNQPHVQIGPGTLIWLVDDEIGEFFRGIVFDRELNSSEELSFTAYDYLIYFLQSKGTYNFQNMCPEDVARKICTDAGVAAGNLEKTGVQVNLLVQEESFYNTIMKAYKKASDNSGGQKQYFPRINGTKFEVIEKGQVIDEFELSPETDMRNAAYSDNIEAMVNRVKIYDDKNNYVGTKENSSWITTFGVFQDTYTVEEGKDPNAEANLMLHGGDSETVVEALGNMKCITGFGVKTKISYVDVLKDSVWYIDADTHTFYVASGKHTMQLTLHSTNIMDSEGE